jgi:arylsulfatase A-like enzyme
VKSYYRLATEVDTVCGRVVSQLKRQGVLEDTLVIFTTDNGYFHADTRAGGQVVSLPEESIRVPLIVVATRGCKPNDGARQSEAMTLNVDLAPTLLKAAQVGVPSRMQGRDLGPLYLAKTPPAWRTNISTSTRPSATSNVSRRLKPLCVQNANCVWWPDFKHEELSDLRADPLEERNLAARP